MESNLTSRAAGLFAALKGMNPRQWKDLGLGRLLVVEVITGGGGLRAMVLRRSGLSIEVEAVVQTPFSENEQLEHEISMLFPLLGSIKPPRDVLLITDEARFITLEIGLKKGEKGKPGVPDPVEFDAEVRREVEPYLDVPVKASLLSYNVGTQLVEVGMETESRTVLISAMSLAVYIRWKKILAKRKLRLRAVMPVDVAFYSSIAQDIRKDECLLVAEARSEVVGVGAILGDGGLVGYQSLPTTGNRESAMQDLAGIFQMLSMKINAAGLDVSRAVVTGSGLDNPEAEKALSNALGGVKVVVWQPGTEVHVKTQADISLFAPLLTAGIAELSRGTPLVPLITDRLSPLQRIGTQVHLIPLVVAAAVLVGLSGHYGYMKVAITGYRHQIHILEGDHKELKRRHDSARKATRQANSLKKDTNEAKALMSYLTGTLPGRAGTRLDFFKNLPLIIPVDVELDSLVQTKTADYQLRGRGLKAASVTRFVTKVRNQTKSVNTVNLRAIEEVPAGKRPGSGDKTQVFGSNLLYSFIIDVNLKE